MAQEQLLGAFSVALRGRQGREGAAGSQDVPVPGTEASREVLWLTFKLTHHSLSVGLGSSQFPHPKMSLKRSLWQQCENSSRAQLKKTRLVFGGLGSVEDIFENPDATQEKRRGSNVFTG